eukprot:m.271005 g.271005  ORF g.271005 m.271005 type:complete len:78 (-) comp26862_c5_seq20:211-444(-)
MLSLYWGSQSWQYFPPDFPSLPTGLMDFFAVLVATFGTAVHDHVTDVTNRAVQGQWLGTEIRRQPWPSTLTPATADQ